MISLLISAWQHKQETGLKREETKTRNIESQKSEGDEEDDVNM